MAYRVGMSISKRQKSQGSVTQGDRALELFTDRYEFTRLFVERLHEPMDDGKILFWHGAGGNGKSLLLKHLRQNFCKRLLPEVWERHRRDSSGDLAEFVTQVPGSDCFKVPCGFLDFGSNPLGVEQPLNRFYGLLLLRKSLTMSASPEFTLKFPRFDFACIWYLHNKGKSIDEIKALFPLNETAGVLAGAVDAAAKNSVGAMVKTFTDFFAQDWQKAVSVAFARLGVPREVLQDIRGLELDTALVDQLPRYWAEDLNAAMGQPDAPKRIVLLLDTYEKFYDQQRSLSNVSFFAQDEWLRRLLRELDVEAGILVLVAGRDRPRWPEADLVAPDTEIPADYLDIQEVGNLSASDADTYLQKVGIEDGALRDALVRFANVVPGEVHPLYLGLSADVVLQAEREGTTLTADSFAEVPAVQDKGEMLINRLLSYVNQSLRYAIHSLSACRAFDQGLFRELGQALNFLGTEDQFEQIISFSFVTQTETERQVQYRLHDLLRRLDDEKKESKTMEAHRFLLDYFQERNDVVEMIFHRHRLDVEAGIDLWRKEFEPALTYSRYDLCSALIILRRDLWITSPFQLGLISYQEGIFYSQLSRFPEACQEYNEAINAYDQVLQKAPDLIQALNNKGITLQRLGDLQASLSQHQEALESYQDAITLYDQVLAKAPNHVYVLNNKGITAYKWGFHLLQQGELESASEKLVEAYQTLSLCLELAPNDATIQNLVAQLNSLFSRDEDSDE
ncbi:MAG: tetratricopeptide repeat protein [Cyanobacteria bacterium P01_F01_bin.42]